MLVTCQKVINKNNLLLYVFRNIKINLAWHEKSYAPKRRGRRGRGKCGENLPSPGKSYALKQEEKSGGHIVSRGIRKPMWNSTIIDFVSLCSEHFLLITF